MKKKKLVRRKEKKNIYVHNDISNAALHLKQRIESNITEDKREGVALDIMSCLIMYAFEFEAKINFIGHMTISNWREMDNFDNKIKKIRRQLKMHVNKNLRPYKTIHTLRDYRNSIAHGKPIQTESDEIDVALEKPDLDGGLYDLCTIEFLRECEEDIDAIWNNWLTAAKIEKFETLTHGTFSTTIL